MVWEQNLFMMTAKADVNWRRLKMGLELNMRLYLAEECLKQVIEIVSSRHDWPGLKAESPESIPKQRTVNIT